MTKEKLEDILYDQEHFPLRTIPSERNYLLENFVLIYRFVEECYLCHYNEESGYRHLIAKSTKIMGCNFFVEIRGKIKKYHKSNECIVEAHGYVFVTTDRDLFFKLIENKIVPSLGILCLKLQMVKYDKELECLPQLIKNDIWALQRFMKLQHPSDSTVFTEYMAYESYNSPIYPTISVYIYSTRVRGVTKSFSPVLQVSLYVMVYLFYYYGGNCISYFYASFSKLSSYFFAHNI